MSCPKPIGGYLELEIADGSEFHKDLHRLNTGRACLEVILRSNNIEKIFLPYYTCEVILEPIDKLNIEYEFYKINSQLEIQEIHKIVNQNHSILYTNYFGLKSRYIQCLIKKDIKNLIIDNSQAFFNKPYHNIDTFYSCRKFFGVPDGAYVNLAASGQSCEQLVQDESFDRMDHLLKRIDLGAEAGYDDFMVNDKKLRNRGIKKMSRLTQTLLNGISYKTINKKRIENYLYLHKSLSHYNRISLPDSIDEGPLAYPFLAADSDLKHVLIKNKIFVPTYWPNVKDWTEKNCFEYELANNLIPLPIDQRIEQEDLDRIIIIIKNYLNGKQ